jgi:bile-acid 7alpha-dehydratase
MKETELEKRIRRLEDIEAIKDLKARYWYYIEHKMWDDLPDLFTEDVIDYMGENKIGCQGKKEVVKHLVDLLTPGRNVHQGHSPIIEFTSDTTAIGKWALNDYNEFDPKAITGFEGWGSYDDEYVKVEGKWKIKSWLCKHSRIERFNRDPR